MVSLSACRAVAVLTENITVVPAVHNFSFIRMELSPKVSHSYPDLVKMHRVFILHRNDL